LLSPPGGRSSGRRFFTVPTFAKAICPSTHQPLTEKKFYPEKGVVSRTNL
jgi:hypothetical protein